MPYRVQISPSPIFMDEAGVPVPNSHVLDITFPGSAIETFMGRTETIVGNGIAKILVGDTVIRGVPLC